MKMTTVSFTEAKARLSKYGRMAEAGKATLVLKHHRPSFLIAAPPASEQARRKRTGLARGQIRMAPDFDVTPEDVIATFEGTH